MNYRNYFLQKSALLTGLFLVLFHTMSWAQTQAVTWVAGGGANNFKSNQKACRANDGYLEFNTVLGYRVGITTQTAPVGTTQMDYGVYINNTGNPHKIEFYDKGVLKLTYNAPANILATHKVRIERKGSLINVYYQTVALGAFNLLYSYTSDANYYYRFHAITTAGGNTAGLNAIATLTLINPCSGTNTPGADATINWAQTKVYDGDVNELTQIAESRVFTNRFGETIQSQTKDFSTDVVTGAETVYDAQGRGVLNTLPAPTGNTQVQYRSQFLKDQSGGVYDFADFDLPITSGNLTGEVNNPKPVGAQTNTVGHYYSNSNTADGYVPTSSYPYSRVEYALDGTVKRVSGIGEGFRMGSGHEVESYTVNGGPELHYFYGGRKSYEVTPDPTDPLNIMPSRSLNKTINATKVVSLNPDNTRSVQFYSQSGLLLAQCVSGRPEASSCPNLTIRHKLYVNERAQLLDEFGTGSVKIHLPASTVGTLKFIYDTGYGINVVKTTQNCAGTTITTSPDKFLEFQIYDLAANKFLVKGTDYTLTHVFPSFQVAFINNYAGKEGFYRISYNYTCEYYKIAYDDYFIRGYEPPITVTYQLDYSNWTINYYDLKGQLRKTVSPQGIDCSLSPPPVDIIFKSSSNKDFYDATSYLPIPFTAFTQNNIANPTDYGPEVNLKVRGLGKTGIVPGPSGGGVDDAVFMSHAVSVDRITAPSPTRPTGGGAYLNLSANDFAAQYDPPTDDEAASLSYPFTSFSNNDDDDPTPPATCFNGNWDPGEEFIDWGGVCPTDDDFNCPMPPDELVSFKITLQFKSNNTLIATKTIYKTLGVDCHDWLSEIENPDGLPSEVEQVITNAQLPLPNLNIVKVDVSEVKVRGTDGNYTVAYAPSSNPTHRFIRYVMLKFDYEKEIFFKNTNAHSLKTSFVYDDQGRVLATQDPDRGLTEYIYDDEGKLRFSQDAVQRTITKTGSSNTFICFNYYIYDAQGRLKETAQYKQAVSLNSPYYFPSGYYKNTYSWNLNDIYCLLNQNTKNSTALTSFIGTYKTDVNQYSYDVNQTLPSGCPAAYQGFFTEGRATKMENGEQSTWFRYNHRGEITATVLQYKNLGANDIGYKTFDYTYDFFGRLKKSTYQLNSTTERFSHLYTYDAAGEMKHFETVALDVNGNEEPAQKHLTNNFYKTGALKRQVLGVATQGLDYVYTIDGRLKSINHPQLDSKDPGGDGYSGFFGPTITPVDVFAEALDYYPNDYVRTNTFITYGADNGSDERWDGRVKSARWNNRHASMKAPAGKETMYKYTYDWEQNLSLCTYGNYTPNAATNNGSGGSGFGTFTPAANSGYTEQMTNGTGNQDEWYDLNGNLKFLKRHKGDGVVIDNLAYNYASGTNKLTHVTESSTFTDVNINHVLPQVANNYVYDEKGDIKEDLERNIKVEYNAYGLISAVRNRSNNNLMMSFNYDATGKRVRKIVYDNAGAVQKSALYLRDAGGTNFGVYEDRVLSGTSPVFLQTEVMLDGGSLGTYFPREAVNKYVYRLSDHLGNVRVTINRDNGGNTPTILSYADYYAWGMTMPGRELASSPRFRLGYQGQEYESKVGMYGFSLRMYDQRLGRWFSTDPYGQHWSPYLAMSNNPVSFVDPDGGWDEYNRNEVTYFVDGMKVEGWEFKAFMNSTQAGDMIFISGASLALDWNGNEFKFYGHRGFGRYVKFMEVDWATAGMKKKSGEDYEGANEGSVTVGEKFFSANADQKLEQTLAKSGSNGATFVNGPKNRGTIKPASAQKSNSTNVLWGGLSPEGGILESFTYNTVHFFKVIGNGIFLKDEYVENLNGYGYIRRGSDEYQMLFIEGMLNFVPLGKAGKVGVSVLDNAAAKGGASAYDGVRAASKFLQEQGVERNFRKQILESFEAGTISLQTADNATFGLRFYGGAAKESGRYLFPTFTNYTNRVGLALPPGWNSMSGISQFQITPGSQYIFGRAASQGGMYNGGSYQMYINNLNNIKK